MKPQLVINELDAERLDNLLSNNEYANSPVAAALNDELDRAEILAPEAMPNDVVSMNSRVRFMDMTNKEELTRTLVYPASIKNNSEEISIMAPLGAALLGLRVGDEMDWKLPNGIETKIKVLELLYQPESAGELHR